MSYQDYLELTPKDLDELFAEIKIQHRPKLRRLSRKSVELLAPVPAHVPNAALLLEREQVTTCLEKLQALMLLPHISFSRWKECWLSLCELQKTIAFADFASSSDECVPSAKTMQVWADSLNRRATELLAQTQTHEIMKNTAPLLQVALENHEAQSLTSFSC